MEYQKELKEERRRAAAADRKEKQRIKAEEAKAKRALEAAQRKEKSENARLCAKALAKTSRLLAEFDSHTNDTRWSDVPKHVKSESTNLQKKLKAVFSFLF